MRHIDFLDDLSKSDTMPVNIIKNGKYHLEHEAKSIKIIRRAYLL